jgi:hypothetical protein
MTTPHNGMVGTKTYLNIATLPELSEGMAALRYAGIRGIETIRHALALSLWLGGGVPAWQVRKSIGVSLKSA